MLESETFKVTDAELPFFAKYLENLQLAIVDFIDLYDDTIYGTSDLSILPFKGYKFYELAYLDLSIIQPIIPEFSNDLKNTIIRLIGHDLKNTVGLSTTLTNLDAEFPNENNGLLGLYCSRFPCPSEFAVYSEESWNNWKIKYLTRNPLLIDWSSHIYLPNLKYSNILLEKESLNRFPKHDEKKTFYDFAGTIAGSPKIIISIEVGNIIAINNFYQYNDEISKLNNNGGQIRNVYSVLKAGHMIYLSVDVENAAFEVFNHHGNHLGEYLFDGRKNKNAEDGRHLNLHH